MLERGGLMNLSLCSKGGGIPPDVEAKQKRARQKAVSVSIASTDPQASSQTQTDYTTCSSAWKCANKSLLLKLAKSLKM